VILFGGADVVTVWVDWEGGVRVGGGWMLNMTDTNNRCSC
jgi:hypothetical protein